MLKYAREDTHFLLYIYDCLRNELHEKNLYQQCLERSNQIALSVYVKPIVKDTNYFLMVGRNRSINNQKQISTLKCLIKWRDYIARFDDESCQYMLPNHLLFQIAKDLPQTLNELKDCCRAQQPPAYVKYAPQMLEQVKR